MDSDGTLSGEKQLFGEEKERRGITIKTRNQGQSSNDSKEAKDIDMNLTGLLLG